MEKPRQRTFYQLKHVDRKKIAAIRPGRYHYGLSLLEIMVATALLTIIIAMAMLLLISATTVHRVLIARESLHHQATIILQYLEHDLQNVPSKEIVPYYPVDSNILKFRKIIALTTSGDRVLGDYIQWSFDQASAGELANGKDDNKNGLCDEGNLLRREYRQDQSVKTVAILGKNIMARDPDAATGGRQGISFTRLGDSQHLSISISLAKRHPQEPKRLIKVNLQRLITLKNDQP